VTARRSERTENTLYNVAAYPVSATRAYVVIRNIDTNVYSNELAHVIISC
jgi:hypothetical protein